MKFCAACGQRIPDKRPRTTGRHSQSARLNGFVQQIAQDTGESFDTIKYHVKVEAIARGYPYTTSRWGETVPQSEAKASVEECGLLIEQVQQLAAELGIVLREDAWLT